MRSRKPKVMQLLAGEPLLAHVLATAQALNPEQLVVVEGHGGRLLRERFGKRMGLTWVRQHYQHGTADALACALPLIPDDNVVLVLCGDVPLIKSETLERMLKHLDSTNSLVLLSVQAEDPKGYGRIIRAPDGSVSRVVEERDATEQQRCVREVNTGLMAATQRHFSKWMPKISNDNAQSEYYLTDCIGLAVSLGDRVEAVRLDDPEETLGVNNRHQLCQAEAALRRRRVNELLLAGATIIDPNRTDIRGDVQVGRDVVIDTNVILEGRVRLGDCVEIGTGCVLKDVEIGAGTKVLPYTLIDESKIGRNARVGPWSRIRPGTDLGDEVHVGNFVEIKKSTVGDNTKINHLAYVGDADIGSKVNVGAGVITCNYDGVDKHRTVIEDQAFIGSDAPLVAPVRIGRGATVGAGSTITEDVPSNALALGRSRQVVIEAWQGPRQAASEHQED